MRTGLSNFADRLVINKPAFLTSRTLLSLWAIYFFATAWLFISSWMCGTFASNLEESNSQATRLHKRPTVT